MRVVLIYVSEKTILVLLRCGAEWSREAEVRSCSGAG